jgi:sec-independent protein translocase protein TatA
MIGDILQPTHLLFVLVVALLVLGPKRLPEAGRALGKGIRDFRSAIGGEDNHHNSIPNETAAPAPAPAYETVAPVPTPAPAQPVHPAAPTVQPAVDAAEQPAEAAQPFV